MPKKTADDTAMRLVNAAERPLAVGANVLKPGETYVLTDRDMADTRFMAKLTRAEKLGMIEWR